MNYDSYQFRHLTRMMIGALVMAGLSLSGIYLLIMDASIAPWFVFAVLIINGLVWLVAVDSIRDQRSDLRYTLPAERDDRRQRRWSR